jgi:hypothetical protein
MRSKTNLRKKKLILAIQMIISMVILSGTLIIPVGAAVTTVKVDPLSQTVSTGKTFSVNVLCVPVQSIKSYELKVVYNPSLIKANSVTKGNIFNGYSTFFNAGTIDNTAGTISNIYNVILGSGSVSSSGTFITISFTAKSTVGTSTIKLNNVGVTNNIGYIPISITNGSVQIIQGTSSSNPPIYESMVPANKSTNIPISTSSLSLTIRDPNGDDFNYSIQTRPNVGSVAVHGTHNGTKQCTISGLKYDTTYRWYANATDGTTWKRSWYTFTTASAPSGNLFSLSGIIPGDRYRSIPISTSTLTITIQNSKGHPFNYYIKTSPTIGSTTGGNKYNGTKTCSISNLAYSTTYNWYVSCKDVTTGQWANQSYSFTTESNNPSGGDPVGGGGGSSSPENELPPIDDTPPNLPVTPTGPTYIQVGTNNYFTTSAFDPDNDTFRLRFDWGDGTFSDWTSNITSNVSISLSHVWTNVSSYNISVIAQDEHGLNSSWSNALNVTISQAEADQAIVAIVSSSDTISTNESVQFDASYCYVPDSTIVSYQWEFGDGKTSSGKKTAYSYTTPGQYEVTLTIMDNTGETYNNKVVVTVANDAEVLAQGTMSFLPILITSGLIGIVFILIMILILLARGTTILQIGKRYLLYGRKWIRRIIADIITELATIRYPKIMKHGSKQKNAISHIKENKPINPPVHYTQMENYTKNVDDMFLQKIHDKIDSL